MTPSLCIVLAYLLGSVPFGLILSNLFGKGKLRESGSKNIGATNVLRTQGKVLGGLTFFLDSLKGFVAYYFLQTECEFVNLVIIAAPVVGHIFSVWLKFQGGKGVATYFGVLAAFDACVFSMTLVVWILTFFLTKISSLSGIASVISSLLTFVYVRHTSHLDFVNQLYVLIAVVVLIVAKHRENIRRLLNSKELRT
jgi:glycerol-3-phosphate acyltransferase PlsY